jgi:hypothetical protein
MAMFRLFTHSRLLLPRAAWLGDKQKKSLPILLGRLQIRYCNVRRSYGLTVHPTTIFLA